MVELSKADAALARVIDAYRDCVRSQIKELPSDLTMAAILLDEAVKSLENLEAAEAFKSLTQARNLVDNAHDLMDKWVKKA